DFGRVRGFFQSDHPPTLPGSPPAALPTVTSSSVTTLTGNLVVAMPRRITEYTLRPYVVAGFGFMRSDVVTPGNLLDYTDHRPALDFGAGVTGFLTKRVGVSWEIRRFQTAKKGPGNTFASTGPEDLSFWRANMSVAIRY